MYYAARPSKVKIYINSARKTASAIKKELGCDVLINGGIYNMSSFQPYCWLKSEGKLYASDQYAYYGYGWNAYNLFMDTSNNIAMYQNYIACVALLKDGQPLDLIYDKAMGGRRGRSAIGLRSDGNIVVWCTSDGAYALTPEQLQTEMQNLGCVSALMLDGGGSCQCITPNGSIASARIVQNYIAVWIAKENTTPPQNTQTPTQTSPTKPACADGTADECKYRLPCHYCLKQYKMCPLVTTVT